MPDGDDEVRAEEQVDLPDLDVLVLLDVPGGAQDDELDVVVPLDLRALVRGHRVLDGEIREREVAGQPGHLDAEHQADPSEADLGDQALKPGPIGRPAGAAEVLVDDQDVLAGPAELKGAVNQPVLQAG